MRPTLNSLCCCLVRTPGILPLTLQATPQQVFARLRSASADILLLESSKAMPGLSEWSWVTGPALAVLETPADGGPTVLRRLDGHGHGHADEYWDDPFDAIAAITQRLARPAPAGAPCDFTGGLAGYLAYDLARHVERLPQQAAADPEWPQMRLLLCDHLLAFDHTASQWFFCSQTWAPFDSPGRSATWSQTLQRALRDAGPAAADFFRRGHWPHAPHSPATSPRCAKCWT